LLWAVNWEATKIAIKAFAFAANLKAKNTY
jgi:hypothetical protein